MSAKEFHPQDIVASEPKKNETYVEWAQRNYGEKWETWMPWIEDKYLSWFGKDNKTSYAAKDALSKTKVTGVDQIDKVQDDVNNLVAGQVGKGGLLQPLGDLAGKEGINRMERGGKGEDGKTAPGPIGDYTDPVTNKAKEAGTGLASGAQGVSDSVTSGAKSAGGMLGGLWGGKKE